MASFDAGLNFDSRDLWSALDTLGEDVEASNTLGELAAGTAKIVGTTFSFGWAVWAIRGGYLATGMLTSLPSWHFLDPLPIFDAASNRANSASSQEEKDVSLSDIVKRHQTNK